MLCDHARIATDDRNQFDLSITVGDATFTASGPSTLVMKALDEFKGLVATPPPRRQQREKADEAKGDTSVGDGTGAIPGIDKPLSVFVKRTWANQAAKATAIVLWARERDKKPSLKPGEIEDYWRKTPGKAVKNPAQVCSDAVKKGWLHGEGRGSYSVTQPGIDVVNAVPLE